MENRQQNVKIQREAVEICFLNKELVYCGIAAGAPEIGPLCL